MNGFENGNTKHNDYEDSQIDDDELLSKKDTTFTKDFTFRDRDFKSLKNNMKEEKYFDKRTELNFNYENENENWEEDGNITQEVYCICRGPSQGEMIGCENKNCPYEWFHYECVGIKSAPVGVWYCDTCKKDRQKKRLKDKN